MGSISKEYSKYNKSEANNFISSVDVLIEKLDTLGYSNSNLMGFIDHINSSNQSNYNSNAAIWHGNSARAFAGKVETYLKNVKKLRILANDYRNAAIDMVEYEETIDEWEGNSPGLLGALETIGASGATGGAIGSALPGIGTVIGAAGGVISGGLFAAGKENEAERNYKKILNNKSNNIEEILNQSTSDEISSYISSIGYSQYCFSVNDLTLESSDFEKEAETFSGLSISCYSSDERIRIMTDNLREKISRINGYLQDLSIAFRSSVSKFQDYSDYLKGKKGDGGRGIYNINVPSLISCKFKEATQYFRTDKNSTNPYQKPIKEKQKIRIELHPGDRGTINKNYIDFYKITDNAYGALQAEAGEGSWIPYENMRPEWWGVYTNDELEYEVRDDGTIWFIDTNSKGQKVYMGFTTVGVLTTCLETQANEGDSPTVYTNEDDSDSSTSHTDENDTDNKDDNSNKEAEETSETVTKNDIGNKVPDSENDTKVEEKSPYTEGTERERAVALYEKEVERPDAPKASIPGSYDNSGEKQYYDETSGDTLTVNVPEEYGTTEKTGEEYVDSVMESAKKIHDRMHGFEWGKGKLTVSEDDGYACCASYVSAVLIDAGVFPYEELDGLGNVFSESGVPEKGETSFNAADDVYKYLRFVKGWERIDNVEDLEPGDICFYERSDDESYNPSNPWNTGECNTGHVDIYMGNGTKFSAGSSESMSYEDPESFSSSTWLCAYRPPKN
ncbi:MAG: hypothetical protein IKE73_03895 [Bacilli bacterium]|nr:hypothetical protein [Bacilli bacterium]